MFRKYLGGNKKLGSSSIVKCKGGKKNKTKNKEKQTNYCMLQAWELKQVFQVVASQSAVCLVTPVKGLKIFITLRPTIQWYSNDIVSP